MGKVIWIVIIIVGLAVVLKLANTGKSTPSGAVPAATSGSQQESTTTSQGNIPVTPMPTPIPTPTAQQRLQAVASQMGVSVMVTQELGNEVHAKVEWMGNVATIGGDYIEQLYREGAIMDFNANTTGQRWYDQQGRSRWVQNFVLKMR